MKEMTGNGLDGFPKDKSHITYPIALCAKMRTSVDKERAVDAIYLPFSQVFDAGGPGQEPASKPWQWIQPVASGWGPKPSPHGDWLPREIGWAPSLGGLTSRWAKP